MNSFGVDTEIVIKQYMYLLSICNATLVNEAAATVISEQFTTRDIV